MLFDCKYRTEIIRKDGAGQQQGKGRPAGGGTEDY